MDILAHALWASAGMTRAPRRWPIALRATAATVALAALPDVPQLLYVALAATGLWLLCSRNRNHGR